MRGLLILALLGVVGCMKAKEVPKGPFEGERYRVMTQTVIYEHDPAALRVLLDENATQFAKQKIRDAGGGGLFAIGREFEVSRVLDDYVVECNVPPMTDISPDIAKFSAGYLYLPRYVFLVPGHLERLPGAKAKASK